MCEGTGKDYFQDDRALCGGLGKFLDDGDEDRGVGELETICAIGDRKPERYGSTDTEWQKIRITLDSGSAVDVMPTDEFCQIEAVPCTGSRANRTMLAANGTRIESKGEKKFQAVTDDGFSSPDQWPVGGIQEHLRTVQHGDADGEPQIP